ncbi:NTP transferase domain-containing protein [Carboxydothermus pertinax]|uniref:NTP transferase domain-containing protein n=1 Tax=Carboxydothermus pertinax TaxID=870242 RepID=UPI00096A5211|nr:NTP transferase domain-containing protein [Carboxydothermus pertinax]
MINALVLAGSVNSGKLAKVCPEPYEALIPLKGRPMVDYVVDSLLKTPEVKQIVVAGPKELSGRYPEGRVVLVDGGESVVESVQKGFKVLPRDTKTLVATSDIPLITPEEIKTFLFSCPPGYDVYYPVVYKEAIEERDKSVRRTYVTLKEGTVTGGNLFLVDPRIVEKAIVKAQDLIKLRKSPFKLSLLLGLGFVIKFLAKKLSVKELEEKVGGLLGIRGKAVFSRSFGIGVDVDKPEDLELVLKYLP